MMFYFIIIVLCLLAVAFLLAPLWLGRPSGEQDRQALNVELFRERLADLDASDEETGDLELEARQDLLADTSESQHVPPASGGNHGWILAAAFLVPLLAGVIYLDFGFGRGAITDVRLMEKLRSLDTTDRAAYESLMDELAVRAERRPKDGELNFFLARSFLTLGQHDDALIVFRRLIENFPHDASLQSYYAEALFVANERKITAEVREAIDKALAMNPHDLTMLEVEGIAAITDGRREDALTWFRKALSTGVTGERADLIRRAIASIDPTAASGGRSLTIAVASGSEVSAPDGAAVFVYARAASGPPAPLAVQRLKVTELPQTIVLNESMAMLEGMGLANFDEVVVIARISLTGDVVPKPGDLEVRSDVIDMNAIPDIIELTITDPVSL